MRIFINQKLSSNINELLEDPSVAEAIKIWGKDDIIAKSAIDLSIFRTPFGSISLLYGPRQIGKTATLKLFLTQVQDSETLIFTDCSTILDKADLAQHLSGLIQGPTTIVLDEVQEVNDWHLALRSMFSEGKLKNCRIWCTGSEARYLLESGERLPGRKGEGKTIFARPWSFREYMDFFYIHETAPFRSLSFKHINQNWLNDQKIDWSKYWSSYLLSGGIPHAVASWINHGKIPDSIWHVYADWILGTWSRVRTPQRSLAALARRICDTLNTRVSYESLKKGTDIQSANTIKTLIDFQEDHFSLHLLARFDTQKEKYLPSKLKKIYPIDPFIARIWTAIGWNIRRIYEESVPELKLDECAFLTQMFRKEDSLPISYLYSDRSKSEIDFYFEECGFELKSNGNPTQHQKELLKTCPQSFIIKKEKLPLMAYLVGEGRTSY